MNLSNEIIPKKTSRSSFCECCNKSYEKLRDHLESHEHQIFASNSSNYTSVDSLINVINVNWVARKFSAADVRKFSAADARPFSAAEARQFSAADARQFSASFSSDEGLYD